MFGLVTFKQREGRGLWVSGAIANLDYDFSPLKGFHVHQNPVDFSLGTGCGSTGGHYNPEDFASDHSVYTNPEFERHIGDLKMLSVPENRNITFFRYKDNVAQITDSTIGSFIGGRGITIHNG